MNNLRFTIVSDLVKKGENNKNIQILGIHYVYLHVYMSLYMDLVFTSNFYGPIILMFGSHMMLSIAHLDDHDALFYSEKRIFTYKFVFFFSLQ